MVQDCALLKTATNINNPNPTNYGTNAFSTHNNKKIASNNFYDSDETNEDSNNDSNADDVSDTDNESCYNNLGEQKNPKLRAIQSVQRENRRTERRNKKGEKRKLKKKSKKRTSIKGVQRIN